MSQPKRRNPVVVGWAVAVAGLIVAILLGWALISIGSSRLDQARKEKAPLRLAISFMASEGITAARGAADSVSSSNWGDAQRKLVRANAVITAMERSTTADNRRQVQQARRTLGEAQEAVGRREPNARDNVDRLILRLEDLEVK